MKLYKNKKPYNRVIPSEYWEPLSQKTSPEFHQIREKFINKAAEMGLEQKQISEFVIKGE